MSISLDRSGITDEILTIDGDMSYVVSMLKLGDRHIHADELLDAIREIVREEVKTVEQAEQRQDSTADQLRDVHAAAVRMGCYDAADWIQARTR